MTDAAIVEGEVTSVPTETPTTEAPPAAKPEDTTATAADQAGQDEYADAPPYVKREITIERNKRRELEARLTEQDRQLSAALQALAKHNEPAQSTFSKPEPKAEQFESDDAFRDAHTTWKAEKIAADTIAEHQRRDAFARQQQEAVNARIRYVGSVEAAKAKHADWSAVAENPQLVISEALAQEIVQSGQPADVQYWLGKHPEEARRISQLSQAAIVREVARIEGRIEAAPQVVQRQTVSQAPKPVKPVGDANSVEKGYDELSWPEFVARRRKEERARR